MFSSRNRVKSGRIDLMDKLDATSSPNISVQSDQNPLDSPLAGGKGHRKTHRDGSDSDRVTPARAPLTVVHPNPKREQSQVSVPGK